jgi:glycosyltransferase involved in cell wall biosynthesis
MRERVIGVAFVLHIMDVAGAEVLVAETIRQLGPRIQPTVICLDGIGQLGATLQAEGVEVTALGRRPGLDLRVARRMASLLRHRAVDVVHAHQYTPFFYSALAKLLTRPRPRLIFTEHGRHYPDIVSARRRFVNRWLFDHLADRVNAVCAFSARSLSERDGFPGARVQVIENGISLSRYGRFVDRKTARSRLGLAPDRRYIACVARFHPVKDHRMLLRAFEEVAARRRDVDLLLVGDGILRGELEQIAADRSMRDRVRFLGVRGDVPDILGAVDLFALTSLSEAASITLLEAMASGLPVVVTDVGGNPEIVRHGTDGLLVPRGDWSATADAMLQLLAEPQRAATMGDAGAMRVSERYRIEKTVERYYALYVELGRPAG